MLLKLLKQIHFSMLFAILGLSALGVLFILSASFDKPGFYELKQCVWIAAGLVIYFMAAAAGYRGFMSMAYLLYAAALFLLGLVFVAGTVVNGAKLWLTVGPIAIQPSEFAKIATLLALVKYVGNFHPASGQAKAVWGAVLITIIPFFLFPFIWSFKQLTAVYKKTGERLFILCLITGLLAFLIQAFFDNHFFSMQPAVLFWIFFGMLIGQTTKIKQIPS